MSRRTAPAATGPAPAAAEPRPAPRISAISYSLGPDHALQTTATYRYPDGRTHQGNLRLDGYRYDLFVEVLKAQGTAAPGPTDVTAALHDLYYVLYAPPPRRSPPAAMTGSVPDRH